MRDQNIFDAMRDTLKLVPDYMKQDAEEKVDPFSGAIPFAMYSLLLGLNGLKPGDWDQVPWAFDNSINLHFPFPQLDGLVSRVLYLPQFQTLEGKPGQLLPINVDYALEGSDSFRDIEHNIKAINKLQRVRTQISKGNSDLTVSNVYGGEDDGRWRFKVDHSVGTVGELVDTVRYLMDPNLGRVRR